MSASFSAQEPAKPREKEAKQGADELTDALCATAWKAALDLVGQSRIEGLHEDWMRIIKAEKLTAELIKQKREAATRKVMKMREETEEEDKRLIEKEAPEHLRRALHCGSSGFQKQTCPCLPNHCPCSRCP